MKLLRYVVLVVLLLQVAVAQMTKIEHVVLILKENHSYDSMFGTFPGSNGATSGKGSTGRTVPLLPAPDTPLDFAHTWQMFENDIDGGKMDKFDKGGSCGAPSYYCYVQYNQSSIPSYWAYAQGFQLADNFYSSSDGPSFPNHQYLIAGQSAGGVNNAQSGWGCDAPATDLAQTYDLVTKMYGKVFPCFDYLTLGDELDAAGVSWRYYAPPSTMASGGRG
jgi:phospholipase C